MNSELLARLESLRTVIEDCSPKDDSGKTKFFVEYVELADAINARFVSEAKKCLKACQRGREFWSMPMGMGNKRRTWKVRSERAECCLAFAHQSGLLLKELGNELDSRSGGEFGRMTFDSLWRNQSGRAAFLHSPMLTEIKKLHGIFSEACSVAERKSISELGRFDGDLIEDVKDVKPEDAAESQTGCGGKFGGGGKNSCESSGKSGFDMESDLKCAICLNVMYQPIGLGCGHAFCRSCLLKASFNPHFLFTVHKRLADVPGNTKCPHCRQTGVFCTAQPLNSLNRFICQAYPDYYSTRREEEKPQVEEKWEDLDKTDEQFGGRVYEEIWRNMQLAAPGNFFM